MSDEATTTEALAEILSAPMGLRRWAAKSDPVERSDIELAATLEEATILLDRYLEAQPFPWAWRIAANGRYPRHCNRPWKLVWVPQAGDPFCYRIGADIYFEGYIHSATTARFYGPDKEGVYTYSHKLQAWAPRKGHGYSSVFPGLHEDARLDPHF